MERTTRLRSILDVASSVFMIAASAAVIWFAVSARSAANAGAGAGNRPAAVETITDKSMTLAINNAPRLGPSTAKVAVVEFSDFECPYCQRFAHDTFETLKKDFIDSGKIAYAYQHMPLSNIHPRALPSAIAAQCAAEQGQFWKMYDRLFAAPSKLADGDLLANATTLGLDMSRFESCTKEVGPAIQASVETGTKLNIRSTPTFLVGTVAADGTLTVLRKVTGAQSMSVFNTAIKEVLDSVSGQ